jgi:hypothetical protein
MNGIATIATFTNRNGSTEGTLDISPTAISVGTNGDDIAFHDRFSAVIHWENINGTNYDAGIGGNTLWASFAWDATSPIASRLTLAVPEPSSAMLAAIGAVGFIACGRSRHRRDQRRQATASPSQPNLGPHNEN